jgi:protein required for attachment to host cells
VKPLQSWVLVADGGTAKVYRTTGESSSHRVLLEPVPGGTFKRSDPAHFGPRPGKNFSSALRDSGHGVTTHEDLKRHAEEEFIIAVLAWLDKPKQISQFEHLIIAAPPRALGEIRRALSHELFRKVHSEIHGDLTKLPIKELEQRVRLQMVKIPPDNDEGLRKSH